MDHQPSSETPRTRARLNVQRGNFYFGLGFALLAGLAVVVGLGLVGVGSLGYFSVGTALAMAGIAITMVAAVSFVTLVTLRRTLALVGTQESALADLAAKVQAQWRTEQAARDGRQDAGIAMLTARQAAVPAPVPSAGKAALPQAAPADPFQDGQVHLVRDVEGIGAHYGKLLDDMGLKDTRRLWAADTAQVARALKVRPAVVASWQVMAELMAVDGIGKQYAELLVRADVRSIDALAAADPKALLGRIERLVAAQGNRIQGNTIGPKAVQGWIRAAQAHHGVTLTVALEA